MKEERKKFKLCYIEGHFAYFTTQELSKQWGDDFDDAPYEHNAGTPYTPTIYYHVDGTESKKLEDWIGGKPNWEIKKICFFGFDNMNAPCDVWENGNSMVISVDDINKKKAPWLQNSKYDKPRIKVWAGCSIEEFKKLVKKGGGEIYVKEEK